MTTESIINQIKLQSHLGLPKIYEAVCEEYSKRLCEAWNIPLEDTWWHGDKIGGGLCLSGWWMSLDMEQLSYMVDNCVAEDEWFEYCDFVESEINNGLDRPRINFHSWFMGLRPKDLKDGNL